MPSRADGSSTRRTTLRRLGTAVFLGGCLCAWAGPPLKAMINPSFTPVHLVTDSEGIVAGRLQEEKPGERWALTEVCVLKGGKRARVGLSLDFDTATGAKAVRDLLRASTGADVLLFEGRFWGTEPGLLLVNNTWFRLKRLGLGDWQITGYEEQMYKTYNGAADKLIGMVEYLLHDDDPDVPVAAGFKWKGRMRIGHVSGPVAGMAALDAGPGRPARLFVASAGGDRLFAWNKEKGAFNDQTESRGLDTASRAFAFVDLNADGRADLVSWDGAALHVRFGREDGGFAPPEVGAQTESRDVCAALTPISPAQDGSPGLLADADWPKLLAWNGSGWSITPLPVGRCATAGLVQPCAPAPGPAGPAGAHGASCVVADWDGDGYVDVLQLRDKESLFWKGKRAGFEEPRPCAVTSGGSPARWCVGDFDTDGRPDLFVSGRDACELWENAGDGRFRRVIQYAGSLQVKRQPGAADCLAADLNHDGRPDLAVLYREGQTLYYHFNRGYRCLGEEGELQLEMGRPTTAPGNGAARPAERSPAAHEAPARAAVGDFNGDGAMDLAVAFTSGEVVCFLNDLPEPAGMWIALPRGRTGPVTVSIWQGNVHPVCLGTYLVEGPSPAVHAGLRRPEPYTLRWRWPGGLPRELQVKENAAAVVPLERAALGEKGE